MAEKRSATDSTVHFLVIYLCGNSGSQLDSELELDAKCVFKILHCKNVHFCVLPCIIYAEVVTHVAVSLEAG